MATKDETNNKKLPAFSSIKPFEQLAIVLRAEGKTNVEITNTINAEYDLAYKEISVREWFYTGGRLEQAYLEYNGSLADQLVLEAKLTIKKLSATAAHTLEELMGPTHAGNVRQQAAKTVLGKYVPDRQILVDESKADDVPDEIGAAGDNIVNGEPNGQEQVDDAPEVASTPQNAGAGGDEAVSESVLPQPAAADRPSDTTT